ncbi:RNA-directed DNA polymerase, eukaryota, nucleotide-binding alpha-beta plait domain protein [Tanacetum coccineum]|uniref:RNA-directed DNA polymerase, eukaryota, nucleotide-binding alpha-beta plait domain protein n=1 Tax=Tanacetum coccineum TaxID=301880 RepID=A0ABQ4YKD4_9ASTR
MAASSQESFLSKEDHTRMSIIDRLVENLCTIWIGRYHLYANKVRFERPNKSHPFPDANNGAAKGLQNLMGKVKDFSSFPNLYSLFLEEGFSDVKLTYLGGMWVMIEFDTVDTKMNLMEHSGIKSWFEVIQDADNGFVSDERIVWVDIEGVPLKAWTRETFTRIGKKWGEMLELEDNADNSFGRKRLCIKTKHVVSILVSFKIVVKGKVFMVRAKELFTWNPSFVGLKERVYNSEDESSHAAPHLNEVESDNDNGTDDEEQNSTHNGGSVLGVLDDIIKVGQSMGYTMEGCAKDLENIIVARMEAQDNLQNPKLKWAVGSDENSKVGESMSRHKAWDDIIHKLTSRLSNWKAKTLSIGGRLTLLKSVLGASPIYSMSIYKVPKGVLKIMEAIRNRFFNGADISDRKITWAALDKRLLASKKNGD